MIKKKIRRLSSPQIILLCFMGLILIGSVLLSLPVCSATGEAVPYPDALFTAATAACVTGLVTLPTVSAWSLFGQAVILLLIQIGGLGVITIVSGAMIMLNKRIGISDRMLISDSFNLNSLSGVVRFVKKVIRVTFLIEAVGALCYMTVFVPEYGLRGIWISVFNSVSAFCNAGIDIIADNSLCGYALNPIVNITTILLIITGGIGFIVWWDIEKLMRGRIKGFAGISLHSKIALSVTGLLSASGAILFFIFEYNNPGTIADYSFGQKIMVSIFQSVTTRTAGFATIPQENLTAASAVLSLVLMFIGGSPGGTAGGIKTVTAFVLFAATLSILRNKRTVDVFNRQITDFAVRKAVAVFVVAGSVVVISTLLISACCGGDFLDIIYETVSATATVGLTRNFTSGLNTIGKLIITMTMYLGRVGPISLAFAFSADKSRENLITNPVEEISVG